MAQKTTAILVDGGFYRWRARELFGEKSPENRAYELMEYCKRHLQDSHDTRDLYRIFYYDCPPSDKQVYHPLLQRAVNLKKSSQYAWSNAFFAELKRQRKVALRMGELLEGSMSYTLRSETIKKLCRNEITVSDLKESDFTLSIIQKGVDMRIGLDIASLAQKGIVNQIVLISGDSDFVPAAKHARREGIDLILDPMWQPIKDSLHEHIDGLCSKTPNPKKGGAKDTLCAVDVKP